MKTTLSSRSNEEQLIIYGCQTVIPKYQSEQLSKLLRTNIDWKFTLKVAQRNAVLPLLIWNLRNRFREFLPNQVSELFDLELQRHVQTNMFMTGKLLELLKCFEAMGINALPFKGPVLSVQAYGSPALRKYGDLDILVRPIHFKKAVDLMKQKGYQPLTRVSWLEKRDWYISRKKDIYLVNQDQSVTLELHWKLSGSHFGLPKEMNRLWDRLESIQLAGTEVPNLAFNDLLIYLCLHGSRHSWERFGWICDINELILSRNEIDWGSFFRQAKAFGCENVVALGMRLIHRFFGFRISDPMWEEIKSDPVYVEMIDEIQQRLFSAEGKPVKMGERYLYHLKLKERRTDRWKLHFHNILWRIRILMTPNELDKEVLNLPRLLYPIYYLTRPARLSFLYLQKKYLEDRKSTRV